jgi:hypothetical protein
MPLVITDEQWIKDFPLWRRHSTNYFNIDLYLYIYVHINTTFFDVIVDLIEKRIIYEKS